MDDRSYMQRLIDQRVAEKLASMAGDILSTYSGRVDSQGIAMLTLGGYMLERFGGKNTAAGEVTVEPDGPDGTTDTAP